MHKVLRNFAVAIVAIVAIAACTKEGSYIFKCYYSASTGMDSLKVLKCIDYTKTDNYFKQETHGYYGLYDDFVIPHAKQDFFNACLRVGEDSIITWLDKSESFRISLVDINSGYIVAYTTWTPLPESSTQE